MNQLFDSLPGMQMPVDRVTHELTHMWDNLADSESLETDSRASQLNLVLHFGLETSPEEATVLFEDCLSFARIYPCRILVLCPSGEPVKGFTGKLFSQCYVGENLREACCCEALILGYSTEHSNFLENQVSVWLESDLPVYHWFHRVPADRISTYYLDYLTHCQRVLYDGEIEGRQFDNIDWPHPARVRDLAYARTLPLRQHLGQFLSGFSKESLVNGLQGLSIEYHKGLWRTASQLLQWHRHAIRNCFQQPEHADNIFFTVEQLVHEQSTNCLRIKWAYEDWDKFIEWEYSESRKAGMLRTNITGSLIEHSLHIEPMRQEKVLSEALFFA